MAGLTPERRQELIDAYQDHIHGLRVILARGLRRAEYDELQASINLLRFLQNQRASIVDLSRAERHIQRAYFSAERKELMNACDVYSAVMDPDLHREGLLAIGNLLARLNDPDASDSELYRAIVDDSGIFSWPIMAPKRSLLLRPAAEIFLSSLFVHQPLVFTDLGEPISGRRHDVLKAAAGLANGLAKSVRVSKKTPSPLLACIFGDKLRVAIPSVPAAGAGGEPPASHRVNSEYAGMIASFL